MITFNSLTTREISSTMLEIINRWKRIPDHLKDGFINPDSPIIVQVGEYGYEVESIGGDDDVDGLVLSVKERPVCKWKESGCKTIPTD